MSHWSRLVLAFALLAASTAPALGRKCPNIMFVVDKSGSMLQDPMGGGNHPNKWELVSSAISQTLSRFDRIPFGLTTYGALGGGIGACYNDSLVEVDIAPHNAAAIRQRLQNPPQPQASTNTGEAIRRAMNDSRELTSRQRSDFIVLITDGTPNCSKPEPDNTVAEINRAATYDPPVHTFVVGFDAVVGQLGVDPGALNLMAIAGREPQADCDKDPKLNRPCYFSATNATKFQQAIDAIIGGLVGASTFGSCDDSCFSLGCPDGKLCTIVKAGDDPMCVPDPCANVTCDEGAYCKDGRCLMPCRTCDTGTRCQQEDCVPDPCTQAQIDICTGNGLVCDRNNLGGGCAQDLCASLQTTCPLPSVCDPITGACVDDPCRLINCPALSTCYEGYCMTDPPEQSAVDHRDFGVLPESIDLSVPRREPPVVQPQCPCSLGGRGAPATSTFAVTFLLGVALLRRRGRVAHPHR